MITLVIKGNMVAAKEKANSLGIAIRVSDDSRLTQTVATCDVRYLTDVVRWFCQTVQCLETGYPDGTLLFYNWSDET